MSGEIKCCRICAALRWNNTCALDYQTIKIKGLTAENNCPAWRHYVTGQKETSK